MSTKPQKRIWKRERKTSWRIDATRKKVHTPTKVGISTADRQLLGFLVRNAYVIGQETNTKTTFMSLVYCKTDTQSYPLLTTIKLF
jgi:hypothetical protein